MLQERCWKPALTPTPGRPASTSTGGGAGPRCTWLPGRTRIPMSSKPCWRAGADFDAPSGERFREGNTPLHNAGTNPNPGVAACYAGCRSRRQRSFPRWPHTPARGRRRRLQPRGHRASDRGREPNVNARDNNGDTPLHSAAWYNPHPQVATALIAGGADVNARDPDGYVPSGRRANERTPLFMAIRRYGVFSGGQPMPSRFNVPVVAALVRGGADLDHTDAFGQTALHAAALAFHGPPPSPCSFDWAPIRTSAMRTAQTPLDYAIESGCAGGTARGAAGARGDAAESRTMKKVARR